MITVTNKIVPDTAIGNYLRTLVNQFFKILPMRESNEPSLKEHMRSLQAEIIGFGGLFLKLKDDSMLVSLISILQYLIDNDCSVTVVKREVFKAITICNKLRDKYCSKGVSPDGCVEHV